ncbi:MAG: hypothetical protein ABIQ12_10300 [Opitutaceae bacterium]
MRKKIASFSLLFAWLCANGGLLDGVQVVAWAKMFAGYAQTMSVTAALRETFDPAKPCEMCLGVASAKEAAQQHVPPTTERAVEKLLLAYHANPIFVISHSPGDWPATLASAAPSRTEDVPVPPPRA